MGDQDHDFGILLGLAYQRFVDELGAHLSQAGFAGVGGSFGYVLRALAQQPLTTSQLAARRFHRNFEQDLAAELGPRRAGTLRAALSGIVEREPGVVERRTRLLRPL
jgi:hypothetical protein